jgi:hypothetical protein
MDVAVGSVIVMLGSDPSDFLLEQLFKPLHGFLGDFPQVQVFPRVFPDGVRAEDKAVKKASPFSLINQAVSLLPGHYPVQSEEGAGNFFMVFAWPVLNVTEGGFCPLALPFSPLDIISLYNCHIEIASPY